jgi:uncharacterized lipoprotein YmbA
MRCAFCRLLVGARARSSLFHLGRRSKPAPRRGLWSIVMLFGTLIAAGCHILPVPQADPAHFYTLGGKAADAPAPSSGGTLRLGLRAIELPVYLKNRALVVRSGDSEIRYEQNHRWAEPLDEAVARVIRARLLAAPTVAAVYPSPFPFDEPRDFDVTVRVLSCEGARSPGGKATVQFTAVFELSRAGGTSGAMRETVARRTFAAPTTAWDGKNFDALATLLGDAAVALGQETAATLLTAR